MKFSSVLVWLSFVHWTYSFLPTSAWPTSLVHHGRCINPSSKSNSFVRMIDTVNNDNNGTPSPATEAAEKYQEEAMALIEKAKKLREEIGEMTPSSPSTTTVTISEDSTAVANQQRASTTDSVSKWSEWAVVRPKTDEKNDSDNNDIDNDWEKYQYRLYLDIGREEGTWMDPRWGASGRRMEATIDIRLSGIPFREDTKLVSDNRQGKSSPTYGLQTASKARLRGGFDSMELQTTDDNDDLKFAAAYRVDNGKTLRFYIQIAEETKDGDITIPAGCLHFSLPCFLRSGATADLKPKDMILSTKEGIISVRQIGWHTGWRREESRIVGVFRAVPMEKARRLD